MGKLLGFGKGQQGNTLRLNYKNYVAEIGVQNSKFVFYVNGEVVHDLSTKAELASPTFTGTVTLPDVVMSGHKDAQVFLANTFQCPATGTDWTFSQWGAALSASKTTKYCWLPLDFLKVGDEIVSYKLFGDCTEAAAATLDCKLIKITADSSSDVTGGALTQITADGAFAQLVTITSPETVVAGKFYALMLTGTTGVGDQFYVNGAEVTVNRK